MTHDPSANGSATGREPPWPASRAASNADQTASDTDQTASDADQTASDADQSDAERDDTAAARDQRAADRDQASADQDHAARGAEWAGTYDSTREDRIATKVQRLETHIGRSDTARGRRSTGSGRDRVAAARDDTARHRDERTSVGRDASSPEQAALLAELDTLRRQTAEFRRQAAAHRKRAARDRAAAAAERTRLEAALRSAYIDELTGAFRREMGWQALEHEIDRARRGDGRFVLAFIDVDGLKGINDRAGHTVGDDILRTLVATMRSRLRSFDPIVRFGGDEFVCGIGGVDIDEVRQRFDSIGESLHADMGVAISVGLATLGEQDGVEDTMARADAAMLEGRRSRLD